MRLSAVIRAWKDDRWVRPFFGMGKKNLALAFFLGLLTFLFASGLMITSGYLISGSALRPETILVLNVPLILVRIFGIGKPILHYLERLCSHDWVLHMTSSLRLKLYRSLEREAIFFRAMHRTGDILGMLAEDIGHLQNLYLRTIFPTLIAWLVWLVVTVMLGFVSIPLALLFFLMMGLVALGAPLVSVAVCGARRTRYKQLRNELYAELTDNVLGIADWVFSRRSEEYLSRYKAADRMLRELVVKEERFARYRDVALQIIFGILAVMVVVWAGMRFGSGEGNVNWIAAFILGYFPLIDAFVGLSAAALDAFSHGDSLARLNSLPRVDDEVEPSEIKKPTSFDLHINKVVFSYPGADCRVVDGIHLSIPQGQKVAVLGRSGSGKSTLLSLIRGDCVPLRGDVTLGGVPTAALGDEICSYIGFIQQRVYLFNMTLLDNLKIGCKHATEEQVHDVLNKVGLQDVVARLPQGLHTMVDEAGLCFSGGERHRIALARVLLQDTPLVMLDEPCVGLDPLIEREVLKVLFEALKGKTIIMVTHHLAGVSACDRVIFIENGAVTLDGFPYELEQTSEKYRKLLAFDRGVS